MMTRIQDSRARRWIAAVVASVALLAGVASMADSVATHTPMVHTANVSWGGGVGDAAHSGIVGPQDNPEYAPANDPS
jgi:hypothetical protein